MHICTQTHSCTHICAHLHTHAYYNMWNSCASRRMSPHKYKIAWVTQRNKLTAQGIDSVSHFTCVEGVSSKNFRQKTYHLVNESYQGLSVNIQLSGKWKGTRSLPVPNASRIIVIWLVMRGNSADWVGMIVKKQITFAKIILLFKFLLYFYLFVLCVHAKRGQCAEWALCFWPKGARDQTPVVDSLANAFTCSAISFVSGWSLIHTHEIMVYQSPHPDFFKQFEYSMTLKLPS